MSDNAIAPKNIWIKSPIQDAIFFMFSGFLGLIFGFISPYLGGATVIITFLIYFGLGLTHFGSTWFFYLDKSNRHYFDTKPWVFYYFPIILILTPIALAIGKFTTLVIIITYWFSGYHVMKQSMGITSLYRGKLGVFDQKERKIDNLVIMSATGLALFGRYMLYTDFGLERYFREYFGIVIVASLALVFVYAFVRWIAATVRRFKTFGTQALPLFTFTVVSILLFTPFLYVENFNVAFMSNLLGHYSQYLVLVWMINHNKYVLKGGEGPKPPFLAYVSKHLLLYSAVLLMYAFVVTTVGSISVILPVVGLTWAHFYVDGFLFRFKDPEVRKLILPYI